jgi:hypothetical protein
MHFSKPFPHKSKTVGEHPAVFGTYGGNKPPEFSGG